MGTTIAFSRRAENYLVRTGEIPVGGDIRRDDIRQRVRFAVPLDSEGFTMWLQNAFLESTRSRLLRDGGGGLSSRVRSGSRGRGLASRVEATL